MYRPLYNSIHELALLSSSGTTIYSFILHSCSYSIYIIRKHAPSEFCFQCIFHRICLVLTVRTERNFLLWLKCKATARKVGNNFLNESIPFTFTNYGTHFLTYSYIIYMTLMRCLHIHTYIHMCVLYVKVMVCCTSWDWCLLTM